MLKVPFILPAILIAFTMLAACSAPVTPADMAGAGLPAKEDSLKFPIPLPCDGFDFPVGPPNAKGYYNAQKFGKNTHLGDDWNGVGGGNSDLGDPVFVVADGWVRFGEDIGAGWGNVMRVIHNIGTKEKPVLVESLYGHLNSMWVKAGENVQRGQQIGTIGNAHGAYWAHLHLELRDSMELTVGGGYSEEVKGFLDPTAFIKAHRPKSKSTRPK